MAFPSGKRWTLDSSTASSSRPCKVVRPGEEGGSPTKSIVSQTGSGTSSPAKGVSHALKRFFRTRKSSKQKTKTGDGDSISNSATPPKNKRSLPDNSENVCYDPNPGEQASGMDDFHRRDVQFLELMYGGQGMPPSSSRAAEPQESADVTSNGFLKYRHRYSDPIQIQTRHPVPVKKRILLTPSSPASFTSPSDGEMPSQSSMGDDRKRERHRADSTELSLETEINGGKYEDELLFQIEMDSSKSENGGENNASRRQTDSKSSGGPSESTRSRKNAPSMQGRRSLIEALEKETEEKKRRRAPKNGSDFVDQESLEESLRTAAILADEGWKREQNEVKLQRRSSIHGSSLFLNRI